MAIRTIHSKCERVLLREGLIHLEVTFGAGILAELHQVLGHMAIITSEWIAIRQPLMRVKRKAQVAMWKFFNVKLGECPVGTAMFRMTGTTIEGRLIPT